MANLNHLGTQFHEMTQSEFSHSDGVQFHGTVNGQIDPAGTGFHVGTYDAAANAMHERLAARTTDDTHPDSPKYVDPKLAHTFRPGIVEHHEHQRLHEETRRQPGYIQTLGHNQGGHAVYAHDPQVISGHLTGYVEPNVRTDDNANQMAQDSDFTKHGVTIPYQNEVEDADSTSYVVPHREDFKTHEDYLVEARAAGKSIPKRAMRGYKVPPGQGKLF